MKCTLILDSAHEEEVRIYAHRKTKLIDAIEQLVSENAAELIGYKGQDAVWLQPAEVTCFIVEDNKVYAILDKERLQVRHRLYQLEEILPDHFIRINQSCLANRRQMKRFSASFSGSLLVTFKNGYSDYVSRRQLKTVKERLGLS